MILAKKNRILTLLMVAAVITGLTSCLKNNGNDGPEPYNARAFFANVATPQYKVSIFQNNADLLNGNGLEFVNIASGDVNPGPAKIDIKRLGADTLLASMNVTLDTLRYFSFFVYGSQEQGIELYSIREDFSDISTSKANFRFYNMVPGSEAVDLFMGDTKLASSRMYEDFLSGAYNGFNQIDPNTVELTVKNAAGEELAKSSVNFNANGGVYTLMYAGTTGDTGNRKPSLHRFQH